MSFRFNQGDRPLPGYTIQRGVGTGGFGEVYYATSDGGKEIALKYLRDNPQVELRGATHCLNLKSPHLVAIHDLKQNEQGEHFVIMEYVNGPSLRDLMNEEPNGLGPQKAAYFLREIGKGLAYLHDRGIVHRDLKPGNIFYEDGYVKIGDYGLSKIMAASQHSGQTMSVGTVHYMAPEIGSGNYDRTIDIYALGVMLYEMLLGRVPFSGASMGEVLMKHLTAQPEVDELPEPFPRVIRKALAKDPKDRYQTVTELISELFEVDDLSRSVAAFEPASLSTLAAHAAENLNVAPVAGPVVGVLGTGSSNVGQAVPPPIIDPGVADRRVPGRFGRIQQRVGDRVGRISGRIDASPIGQRVTEAAQRPQNWIERIFLALIVCAGMSIGATVLSANQDRAAFALAIFTSCVSIVGGVILGHWISVKKWFVCVIETGKMRLDANGEEKSHWMPGIVSAVLVAAVLFPLTPFEWNSGVLSWRGNDWILAILSAVVLFDWRSRIESGRQGKVSLGPAFSAGLYAFLVGIIFLDDNWVPLAAMLAAASLGVQAVAGIWPSCGSSASSPDAVADPAGVGGLHSDFRGFVGGVAISRDGMATGDARMPPPVPQQAGGTMAAGAQSIDPALLRSNAIRAIWFFSALLMLMGMIFAFASIGFLNVSDDEELAAHVIVGIVLAQAFLFSLSCAFPQYKKGLWRGIFRKAIFFGGLALAGGSGVAMGLIADGGEEEMLALGGIILGGISALFVWFIPTPAYVPPKPESVDSEANMRIRRARRMKISGALCLGASVLLTPILLLSVHPRDHEELPVVLVPLAVIGIALMVGGIAHGAGKSRKPEKLDLPIRRLFLVDSISDFDSILERHTLLNGFRLKNRGELFWLFNRGDWTAQFWQSDIRRWKTELSIAAYENATGGYRVTCQLDIDAGFSTPKQEMLHRLNSELADLQDMLNGHELPETKIGIAV